MKASNQYEIYGLKALICINVVLSHTAMSNPRREHTSYTIFDFRVVPEYWTREERTKVVSVMITAVFRVVVIVVVTMMVVVAVMVIKVVME
jgi:hypothetical protein